jgi:hypothetical protein
VLHVLADGPLVEAGEGGGFGGGQGEHKSFL